jgi:hypothetical protein
MESRTNFDGGHKNKSVKDYPPQLQENIEVMLNT